MTLGRQIDDRKTPMAKGYADICVSPNARIVRTTVSQTISHLTYDSHIVIKAAASSNINEPTHPTHQDPHLEETF
jgi:hypothetical protein